MRSPLACVPRELRADVREAMRAGWQLTKGRNHIKLRRGSATVVLPATTRDWRSIANTRADMRRAGAIGAGRE